MTFTIHRGASEIGGSCVEINTSSTRLIIDIGLPLTQNDTSTDDLQNEKVLPDIPSLFGSADDKQTALLISHAHQDHYGLMSYVDKDIPVYLGEATHKLIELTAIFTGKEKVIGKPLYIENEIAFTFGDIEITPYIMDHAAFDAYAFLIRGEGKSLLYTGDFRGHGRKSKIFYKFLHIAPKNVDWLLMEGTSLSRSKQRFLIITIHTSGHADYYTLQKLLDTIQPVEVVPIHTTEAENYKVHFPKSNIKQVFNGETVCE
jgi:ribonuclease J